MSPTSGSKMPKRCKDCNAVVLTPGGPVCDINIVYCKVVKYIYCPFVPMTIWQEDEVATFKERYGVA